LSKCESPRSSHWPVRPSRQTNETFVVTVQESFVTGRFTFQNTVRLKTPREVWG
jgi:hypothetical protein